MKDLKLFNKLNENIKYKLAIVGLSGVLAATTLSGCGKKINNNYSLEKNVEALSKDEKLTNIDEYLLENKIEKLDKEYNEAYKNKDIYKSNEIMNQMTTLILKALTAESYNIDFNEIKNFEVIGLLAKDYIPMENEKISKTEYGIKFNYNGTDYTFEASDGLARKLCVIARAGLNNQLVSEEEKTENDYFKLPIAYEKLKEALYNNLYTNNKKHSKEYTDMYGEKYEGNKFNGYITTKYNQDKADTIEKSLKKQK